MRIKMNFVSALSATAFALVASSLPACESSDLTSPPPGNGGTPEPGPGNPGNNPEAGTTGKPLYAIQSMIVGDNATTYVLLLDSLDAQPNLTLEKGREFAGYAAAAASQGKLIVSDGERPQLTRYSIGEDRTWNQEQTLSFSNFASTSIPASTLLSPTVAYAPFDATNHVVWNPLDFTIVGPMTAPASIPLTRGAMNVYRGYGHAVAGNFVYQPYYWSTADYTQYTETSQIAVIDGTKNEVTAAIDAPCPHLHLATKDDDGNLYFSNGQYSVASAVLRADQPKNCIARVKAGETTLDAAFTVHFRDLAEGREGGNFFYLRDGIGFFNAYHAERDNITPDTDPKTIEFSSSYHLWTLDLKTMKAKIMEGIDYIGGQAVAFSIDNRAFVAVPKGDYTSTAIYEVLPDGTASKRFDVQAWTFNMFRVR